jgi:CHRD domain/PEP-CTERM motif
MRKLLTSVAALMVLFVASTLQAQTALTANITTDQEPLVGGQPVTPTTSSGAPRSSSGSATFVLSPTMDSLSFTATILGLDLDGQQTPADPNDNLANAHIHISDDPNFMPPTNAPVRWGFFGSPDNETAPDDLVVTLAATGAGGTISGKWDATEGNNTTLAPWVDDILAGRAYINFHTTQFPGGEIRGAIIPEPSSIALLGIGLIACGLVSRRRRAK